MNSHADTPTTLPASRWVFLGVLVMPLLFAFYTNQVWEDYYITFRSSRNLVEGHGLVYQPGERVHTFTSPLGVLLPALSLAATGSDPAALWFFRGLCALALAGASVFVLAHARQQGWSPAVLALALALGVIEAKIVAFTINGMETAILVFFTMLCWHELWRDGRLRLARLAVGYAGLMWTRPDACVLAAAITLSALLFRKPVPTEEARGWRLSIGRAILLGGLLYAPWFFWAWHYYGSPVPQTIIAKSVYTSGFSLGRILLAPFNCLISNTPLDHLFLPIYARDDWPAGLIIAGRTLARLAAFVWLIPGVSRPTKAASLSVLLGGIYLQQITPYPWYYAPWTMLAALALAGGGQATLTRIAPTLCSLGRITTAVLTGSALLVTATQAYSARVQQQVIEEHGRKAIGLWLQEHASPGDRVFLEPVGYIGYFSRLKIQDFPGLCAPEVSAIVRSGPGGYSRIIAELKPDWLVLRPYEIADQNLPARGALADYDAVLHSNRHPALSEYAFLPGRRWMEFDAEFVVYRRR